MESFSLAREVVGRPDQVSRVVESFGGERVVRVSLASAGRQTAIAAIPERIIVALHEGRGPFETTIESLGGGFFDLASLGQSEHHRGQVIANHHPQLERMMHLQDVVHTIALALAQAGRTDVLFLQPSQDMVSSVVGPDGVMPITIGEHRSRMAHFLNGGIVASTRSKICCLSEIGSDGEWEEIFEVPAGDQIHCFPRVRAGRAAITTTKNVVAVDLMAATNIVREPRKVKSKQGVRRVLYLGRLGGDSRIIAMAWQDTPTRVVLSLWPEGHIDMPIPKITAALSQEAAVA